MASQHAGFKALPKSVESCDAHGNSGAVPQERVRDIFSERGSDRVQAERIHSWTSTPHDSAWTPFEPSELAGIVNYEISRKRSETCPGSDGLVAETCQAWAD